MQLARAALVTFTLLLGCNKDSDESTTTTTEEAKPSEPTPSKPTTAGFDAAKFEQESAAAMKTALTKPAVAAAFTNAWETIAADPQVASAGQALMTAIGEHEKFTPAAAQFMAKLQTSPAFLELVTNFMTSSGALSDPAGLEVALARHVDAQIARPEFNGALDAVIARVMAKPEVEAAIARFVDSIIADSGVALQVTASITAKLTTGDVLDKLNAKAGTSPSDPDYQQKLFAYLIDEARLERFLIGFAELFAKHQAPRDAVVELLRSPAVVAETSSMVADMISAPDFYPLAEAAMVATFAGADQATLESKIEAVLNHPEVVAAMVGWLTNVATVPEVQKGCSGAFQQLFTDPEFEQLLVKTFAE